MMEAMANGFKYKNGKFPTIITCPSEVSLSILDIKIQADCRVYSLSLCLWLMGMRESRGSLNA